MSSLSGPDQRDSFPILVAASTVRPERIRHECFWLTYGLSQLPVWAVEHSIRLEWGRSTGQAGDCPCTGLATTRICSVERYDQLAIGTPTFSSAK
jgi:hypothetical protein